MQLSHIRLQNYRNIDWATLDFSSRRHFFLGPNGQGKSNILEAIHLLTSTRSFRPHDNKALIKHNSPESKLLYNLQHENLGPVTINLTLTRTGKKLSLNDTPIKRLTDFVGLFPTTVMSSEDIQLLRGSPSARRRFLDGLLACTDPDYFEAIRRYNKLLDERNALLKKDSTPDALFNSFESMMADTASTLIHKRHEGLQFFQPLFESAYKALGGLNEPPELLYMPDTNHIRHEDLLTLWIQTRKRDRILKSTSKGPHKDDLHFKLHDKAARHFASEGQQRCLVIALRLAQVAYLKEKTQITPILLADDVLGQLDPVRQKCFWDIIGSDIQLIATGTIPPSLAADNWRLWNVKDGSYEESPCSFSVA